MNDHQAALGSSLILVVKKKLYECYICRYKNNVVATLECKHEVCKSCLLKLNRTRTRSVHIVVTELHKLYPLLNLGD